MSIKLVLSHLFILVTNIMIAQSILKHETCITNNTSNERYASYSPDGNSVAFESDRAGHWDIFIMHLETRHVEKLTFQSSNERRPSWHPNGKLIIFESDKSGVNELYLINIKTKKIRRIKTKVQQGEYTFASFSPNGKLIAVSHKLSDDISNILLLNKSGKIVKQLTQNKTRTLYPKWSNDGKDIVYFSRKDTDNKVDEIYRMNVESGSESRLTEWSKHNFCPSWSNKENKIAYVTSMENSRPEIYIMNSDGSEKMRVTYNDVGDTLPHWHPFENKILVTAYRNGNYELCELTLN